MTSTHRRIQAGGDPAQGPVREMANPTPGPSVGEDFPDRPDHRDPAAVDDHPQDRPDLDAFAARIGTDRLADDSGDDQPDGDGRGVRRAVDRARSGLSRGLGALAGGLRTVADRLQPPER